MSDTTKFVKGFALPLIIGIIILAFGVIIGGYLFVNKGKIQTGVPGTGTEKTPTAVLTPAEQRYEGDDFSINVPAGWSTQNQMPGTLVTIMNLHDSHPNDPAAAKINFKSYISVTFDATQDKNLSQLTSNVKTQITQTLAGAKIINEQDETVDAQPAKFMTMTLTQQEVDFTVMMAIVAKGEKYFVIGGNTPTSKWEENKPLFEKVAGSFKFKY